MKGHTHNETGEVLALRATELLDAETKDVENRIDSLMLEEDLVESKPGWVQNPVCARAEDALVRCLNNQLNAYFLTSTHSG